MRWDCAHKMDASKKQDARAGLRSPRHQIFDRQLSLTAKRLNRKIAEPGLRIFHNALQKKSVFVKHSLHRGLFEQAGVVLEHDLQSFLLLYEYAEIEF